MLGASSYTYAEATLDQQMAAWVERYLMSAEGAFNLQAIDHLRPRPALR